MTHLKPLYPPNYEFTDWELCAWKKMMKSIGYTNIMPYKKEESKVNFRINKLLWFEILIKNKLIT